MAQLNDLIVTGSSRFLNKIQGTASNADLASTANLGKRRIFIQGTQTTATTTGLWTGDASPYFNSADDLTDGQEITYWLPLPTTGNATLNLKFGNGTSSGAVNCYYGSTSRLTTHYGQGNAIHLTYRKNVKIPSTGSTTYTGWWADANYDSNSNTIDVLQGTYTIPVAGATAGLKQYSLFAEDANGKYSSFTTQNGTAVTKTVNRTDYFDISKIYYCSTGGNYAANANIGTSIVRWAQPLVDLRYTLNIATNALTARKPLYLVFDKAATTANAISDTLYKLAGTGTTDWWTQTLPTSADGKIYAEISKAVYDGYRGDLSITHKYYEYTDKLHDYDSISALKNANTITATFEISSGSLVCDIPYEVLVTYKPEQIKGRFHLLDTSTETVEYTITDSVVFIENENYNYLIFYFKNATIGYSSMFAELINTGSYNTAFTSVEGCGSTAFGYASHAEGMYTVASSTAAHAEGSWTTASGNYSHTEGWYTIASGQASHVEGKNTRATALNSHAEGIQTTASGNYSHTEGGSTIASGECSHAEGGGATASANHSHAGGLYTIANAVAQTAIGEYNSTVADALFIVGKGTATNARSNAMYVTTAGELYTSWLNGTVRSTPLSDGKFNRLVMPPYTTGSQLYPLQVEYGRTLSNSGIGTFGVLTNYNTYTVDLNIALTQQSNPYVFNATISYPTTMYSAPKFIFLIPRDKSTGANSRVCYNNGYGIDRQPINFPASAWSAGKTSGVHQFYAAAGSAGTAYITVIMGWR